MLRVRRIFIRTAFCQVNHIHVFCHPTTVFMHCHSCDYLASRSMPYTSNHRSVVLKWPARLYRLLLNLYVAPLWRTPSRTIRMLARGSISASTAAAFQRRNWATMRSLACWAQYIGYCLWLLSMWSSETAQSDNLGLPLLHQLNFIRMIISASKS